MNTKHIALSSVLALAAFSGSAFAAGPASGEGPLFLDQPAQASTVSRAEVRAEAARQQPVAGDLSEAVAAQAESGLTRAEVRAQVREAVAHGRYVTSGELS
ncbi:MAG: DUF4148 domain-containing protein [Ottowia sp.]|uniref:DUF4148 domain-containing protein n=1 Tax=Ottowia sp. TaxID=1898956 RepID=UPI0039E41B7B